MYLKGLSFLSKTPLTRNIVPFFSGVIVVLGLQGSRCPNSKVPIMANDRETSVKPKVIRKCRIAGV